MPSNKWWGIYRTDGGMTLLWKTYKERLIAKEAFARCVNTVSVQWTMKEVQPDYES